MATDCRPLELLAWLSPRPTFFRYVWGVLGIFHQGQETALFKSRKHQEDEYDSKGKKNAYMLAWDVKHVKPRPFAGNTVDSSGWDAGSSSRPNNEYSTFHLSFPVVTQLVICQKKVLPEGAIAR
jgi:hypothetical protein